MSMKKYPIWALKSKNEKRFKQGHPWVFSNELSQTPKGIEPGDPIELRDAGGEFLAYGFGNPHSLIAFRAVTRQKDERDIFAPTFIQKTLAQALKLRESQGYLHASFRWIFGEADGLPGLILDRYLTTDDKNVFVMQAQTAGAQKMISSIVEVLSQESKTFFGASSFTLILKNNASSRKLEGLEVMHEAEVLKKEEGLNITDLEVWLKSSHQKEGKLPLSADFLKGQKTGLFLDQSYNIELFLSRFQFKKQNIKILDLCSYVGHWSAQLGKGLSHLKPEVTLCDASEQALSFAKRNLKKLNIECITKKMDVLTEINQLKEASYDIVICDPPALIKGRKNIPQGKKAYFKLNQSAMKLLTPYGVLVSCSCSGILEEKEFETLMQQAALSTKMAFSFVARGGQSGDHPLLLEFPEGRYLKCLMGVKRD